MSLNSITFAGHSAVFLDIDGRNVAIDPWLEGNPLCPPELKNPPKLDLICLTHGHGDHASDVLRLFKLTDAQIAASWDLCTTLVELGVPESKVIRLNLGGEAPVENSNLKVGLTLAFHSSVYTKPSGERVFAGDAAGVIVKDKDTCIYHAGDTALFSDMSLIGKRHKPDIGFFPIGDRVTMGSEEAATAAKLVGVKLAIPIHFETFGILSGQPKTFVAECERLGIETLVLKPGERKTKPLS